MTPFEEKLRKLYENAFGQTAKEVTGKRMTAASANGKFTGQSTDGRQPKWEPDPYVEGREVMYIDEPLEISYKGNHPDLYEELNFRERVGTTRYFHPHPTAPDRYFTTEIRFNPENELLEFLLNDPISAKDGKTTTVLKSRPYDFSVSISRNMRNLLSRQDRDLHYSGRNFQRLAAEYKGNVELWVYPTLNKDGGINFETTNKENRRSLNHYIMNQGGDILVELALYRDKVEDFLRGDIYPGLTRDMLKAHIEEDYDVRGQKVNLMTRIFPPKPQVLMSILPFGEAIVNQTAHSVLMENGYLDGEKGISIDAYIPGRGSEMIGIIHPKSVEEAKMTLKDAGYKVITQSIEEAALNEERKEGIIR